jgi:hypothetical protein
MPTIAVVTGLVCKLLFASAILFFIWLNERYVNGIADVADVCGIGYGTAAAPLGCASGDGDKRGEGAGSVDGSVFVMITRGPPSSELAGRT